MKKEMNQPKYLHDELFEQLLPAMIYQESKDGNNDFIKTLQHDGQGLIHALSVQLCQEENLSSLFQKNDFSVQGLKKGGINIIQIDCPVIDSSTSNIESAFLLFTEDADNITSPKYFIIKRLQDERIFIIHITPEGKALTAEDLTDHAGDKEYQYWRLANVYFRIVVNEMKGSSKK